MLKSSFRKRRAGERENVNLKLEASAALESRGWWAVLWAEGRRTAIKLDLIRQDRIT